MVGALQGLKRQEAGVDVQGMKTITLHPGSVLAGLALAGALTIMAGAAQSPGTSHSIPIRDVRLVGGIPAEWWTYVEIRTDADGTPTDTYTVPPDRYFVVTRCTISQSSTPVLINGESMTPSLLGVSQYSTTGGQGTGYFNSGSEGNGTRVPLPPGASLALSLPSSYAYLWGYLEPAQ